MPANTNLRLNGDVIAKIYMGTITNWNDPAIKALNPKATIPDLKITPVYRTGNSGTTYNFTDYLSAVSPTWKSQLGTGQSVNWPAGIGANGNAGVAGDGLEHARERSVTRTPRSRSRTTCTSRRSRITPGSSSTRASATSRLRAAR